MTPGWAVERARGAPSVFHARPMPDPVRRAVWVLEPDRPALVLGSAQRDTDVDHAAADTAGVEVVRRRSGGGAVLLVPGDVLWVDVLIPGGDPLWDDDVGRAFLWLGRAWAAALRSLGIDARVHDGAMARSPWSGSVCFAGLGPGEVTVAGRKVVGISQRRTKAGARFQCAALSVWDPAAIAELLAVDVDVDAVAAMAAGVGVDLAVLEAALLLELPD